MVKQIGDSENVYELLKSDKIDELKTVKLCDCIEQTIKKQY